MTQKPGRILSPGKRVTKHRRFNTEGCSSLLREHLAPQFQQHLYYQDHPQTTTILMKGQNSILYPKKPSGPVVVIQKPASFQNQIIRSQFSPTNAKSGERKPLKSFESFKIHYQTQAVRQSTSLSNTSAAQDWNKRHQLDNGRLRDLQQTNRSATQTKFGAFKSDVVQPRKASPSMPYTKKAMQERFANRTYMRTEQDVQFDPLKQACLSGQVQLQIKSAFATPAVPTILMKKQRQKVKDTIASLCTSDVKNYEKNSLQKSLNANLLNISQTEVANLSRNSAGPAAASTASAGCRLGIAAAPLMPEIQKMPIKISHRRYHSGGTFDTSNFMQATSTTVTNSPQKSPSMRAQDSNNSFGNLQYTTEQKCQSQRKKSDLSIGQISYNSRRRPGSRQTMELSVALLNSINIDSDRNSNMSSVRTLRVDTEDYQDDSVDSDDHFMEKSARMLPTISCENMELMVENL